MPTVYGHKLRWVEDQVPCTVCEAEHDGKWFMVKNFTTGDLYCRDCLEAWKEFQRAAQTPQPNALGNGLCSYD